jgi:SAM-dependent methyltransferase
MFDKSAQYYDVIYSLKDYKKESEKIRNYILGINPNVKLILDVACGTGEHAFYLKDYFNVDGIDLNKEFVGIANQKNAKGEYFCGDMTSFDLDKKYDVVMCLFSSIGYVQTIENVVKTLKQCKAHLNDEGMILVEPWFTPDVWQSGRVDTLTAEKNGIKMCRMTFAERQGNLSIMKFHYLLGDNKGIDHYVEVHKMGLFTVEEMKQAFEEINLKVDYDSEGISGRGLYIGRK